MTTTVHTDGVTLTSAAWFNDVDAEVYKALTAVAGTNTITATGPASLTAHAAGKGFTFVPANTNTGSTTINPTCNSVALGAKNIFWNGVACVGGELRANIPVRILYDGTQYHITGNGFNAPFNDAHPIVSGSADPTKKIRIEADGLSTATTRVITMPDRDVTLDMSAITASLGGAVNLSNTGTYFDGPSIAQGAVGTWFVIGTVTVTDTVGVAQIHAKLWDGTTVISSSMSLVAQINQFISITLSGFIASPVGNLRISCKDASSTSGAIANNSSGLGKDSTITAIRVA